MSDAFDVEAILEEQAAKATSSKSNEGGGQSTTEEKDVKTDRRDKERSRERSSERRRHASRSRERERDRDRDRRRDSRDRRRSPDHNRRRHSRSRERRDTRDRDRDRSDRDRDRSDRDRDSQRPKESTTTSSTSNHKREDSAEREAARRQREIDDLTKDQRTLFVGQLTKKVGERHLEDFFSQIGKVRSIIMLRDKFTGQHKGFGYVEMAELEAVPNCLLFNNVVPDFQKFPILVKASEAEKNYLAKKDAQGGSGGGGQVSGSSGAAIGGSTNPLLPGGNAGPLVPAPDTRVYVGNIHVSLDEISLRAVFEQFGPIESLKLNRDSMGNSKGYAFVKYVSHESAKMAMAALPTIELVGRMLKVGHVTDHTNRTDPLNLVASITEQQSNWKLDADDNGQGVAMDATRRLQLMAKLGERAGITVPVPILPTAPSAAVGVMSGANTAMPPKPAVPPVGGVLSRCVRIMNMFDPATETQPGWDGDIREDVIDQCASFGRVEHCFVDTKNSAGYVYFRMLTSEAAQKAAENLNGRYFAGRMIMATYLDDNTYASLAK